MLFPRPKKTITQMCIEFDAEFDTPQRSDTKLVQYLYHIYYSLAIPKNYFKKFEDYSDYAMYAATTVYVRFLKKLKNGEKIGSVLNYVKASMYPLKVAYQNETFCEVINPEANVDTSLITSDYKDSIQADYNEGLGEALEESFDNILKLIRKEIAKSPYCNNPVMVQRLYYSCVLTLIKSFTLNRNAKEKIKQKTDTSPQLLDSIYLKAYEKDRELDITLWHLDASMHDYIVLLVNLIKGQFAAEIEDTVKSFELDDNVVDAIMKSAYNYTDNGDEE